MFKELQEMIEGDTVFLFFHKSKSLKDWFHDFFMKTVTYNGRKYSAPSKSTTATFC